MSNCLAKIIFNLKLLPNFYIHIWNRFYKVTMLDKQGLNFFLSFGQSRHIVICEKDCK